MRGVLYKSPFTAASDELGVRNALNLLRGVTDTKGNGMHASQ